ncbi:MAG: FMN-binding protein [Clostridia bacterium]
MASKSKIALITMLAVLLCGCNPVVKVTLISNGVTLRTQTADYGASVPGITPSELGYRFLGFFKEGEDKPFDFSTKLFANLTLVAKFKNLVSGKTSTQVDKFTQIEVNPNYKNYGELDLTYNTYLGQIQQVYKVEQGYYLVARANYGIHKELRPYVEIGIGITNNGVIGGTQILSSSGQSQGYIEKITPDYLSKAYDNMPCQPELETSLVTGATVTSNAVLYAVRTATTYLSKTYGIEQDTSQEQKETLMSLFNATYTTIDQNIDIFEGKAQLGTVIYSASGVTTQGQKVVGAIIRNRAKLNLINTAGGHVEWDDSQTPNPYTLVIIVDISTKKVIACSFLVEGNKKPQFVISQELLNVYKQVVINSPTAYDNFENGLIKNLDVELVYSPENNGYIIAGTSTIYSGATKDGTFSSQFVRLCFKILARYYCSIKI